MDSLFVTTHVMESPHTTIHLRSYVADSNYAPKILAYAFHKFCLFLNQVSAPQEAFMEVPNNFGPSHA
jgi:hypothetical protein